MALQMWQAGFPYLQLLLQLRDNHRYSILHLVASLFSRLQHLMLAFG